MIYLEQLILWLNQRKKDGMILDILRAIFGWSAKTLQPDFDVTKYQEWVDALADGRPLPARSATDNKSFLLLVASLISRDGTIAISRTGWEKRKKVILNKSFK